MPTNDQKPISCPGCGSPQPTMHPTIQGRGIVCGNAWRECEVHHQDYPNLELRQHLRDLREWVPKRQAEIRQALGALQDESERLEDELLRVRRIVREAAGKQPYSDD